MFRPLTGLVPPAVMLACLVVSGCSSPHVIKMNDGREIITRGMPHYDEDSGFYQFTTVAGENMQLNRNLIESITKK
ncbi:YgdI/YgdR family lipoprotein [Kistimonas asteriae]|uniref:YgdI/YgdR family lipoprotein n=1 Tax=Kistimonas asteriae TaxID=517724 RepID=UPI001BA5FCF5|nr:YgdI/YgdR family lipoprotein [Kistimonas asteriae]